MKEKNKQKYYYKEIMVCWFIKWLKAKFYSYKYSKE